MQQGRALSCPPFFVARFENFGTSRTFYFSSPTVIFTTEFYSSCAEKLYFSIDLVRSLRLGKLYAPPRCLRGIHRLTGDVVAAGDQEVSVLHLPFMRRKICEMVYRSRFTAIVPLLPQLISHQFVFRKIASGSILLRHKNGCKHSLGTAYYPISSQHVSALIGYENKNGKNS